MIEKPIEVKVDLHVHSHKSDEPYSWFLRSAKAAECYTPVKRVYEFAMARGMNLVTITDHDTIDGFLELMEHYPENSFISEEVSARFPEDGCIVHTIALDITEEQHREIQRLRRNVYELIGYMDQSEIEYYWCHPLSMVNGRQNQVHVEKSLLMFKSLELRNGTRSYKQERELLSLIENVTPAKIEEWANKYPEVPLINTTGHYAFTGGSDDHGSLAIAKSYTTFMGQPNAASLKEALRARKTQPAGEFGSASVLAHNCYGVLGGFLESTGQLSMEPAEEGEESNTSISLLELLNSIKTNMEKQGGLMDLSSLTSIGHSDEYQDKMKIALLSAFVMEWRSSFDKLGTELGRGRLTDFADAIGELVRSTIMELPYIISHRHISRDDKRAKNYRTGITGESAATSPRIAILSDTVDDVNGVAVGLQRLIRESGQQGHCIKMIGTTSSTTIEEDGDIIRIPSVYDFQLDEYQGLNISIPHFTSLLEVLSKENIDIIQCSTPGPVGLAGLLAAKVMNLTVIGQYHTDFKAYALKLTGDPTVALMVDSAVAWFYKAMDRVLVPSEWTSNMVKEMGVAPDKVQQVARGIDLNLFKPARSSKDAYVRYGLNGEPKLLYVGRVSKEKNLHELVATFEKVREEHADARLVIVGDGPFTDELKSMFPADGVVFTGMVRGEELARLYASSDIFVFPSETETFGNVVVEAQAAGLPVVVSNRGAAQENVVQGVTGFVCDTRDAIQTSEYISELLRNNELRTQMGKAATDFANQYSMEVAANKTMATYREIFDTLRCA